MDVIELYISKQGRVGDALSNVVIRLCSPHALGQCPCAPRVELADYAAIVEDVGRRTSDEVLDVFLWHSIRRPPSKALYLAATHVFRIVGGDAYELVEGHGGCRHNATSGA